MTFLHLVYTVFFAAWVLYINTFGSTVDTRALVSLCQSMEVERPKNTFETELFTFRLCRRLSSKPQFHSRTERSVISPDQHRRTEQLVFSTSP